jgi:5'-nucleotidase
MAERVKILKNARVLISNDDGINAPGLKRLERVMRKLAREVWVVAPETEQSAASHSLTIRRPLRIRKVSNRRYAVNGTPTDSVLLGIIQVLKDNPPDLVLSGVNCGGNLGEDVIYSGTVAAAMEGTLLGFPAIAFSQVNSGRHPVKWSTMEKWLPKVLKGLVKVPFPSSVLFNVNFPDIPASKVKGIEVTSQGRRKIGCDIQSGVDPRGDTYYWVGPQRIEDKFRRGSDLEAVNRGVVSISALSTDLSHIGSMKTLKEFF